MKTKLFLLLFSLWSGGIVWAQVPNVNEKVSKASLMFENAEADNSESTTKKPSKAEKPSEIENYKKYFDTKIENLSQEKDTLLQQQKSASNNLDSLTFISNKIRTIEKEITELERLKNLKIKEIKETVNLTNEPADLEKENFKKHYAKEIVNHEKEKKRLVKEQKKAIGNIDCLIKLSEAILRVEKAIKKSKKDSIIILKYLDRSKSKFLPTRNKFNRNYFYEKHYGNTYSKTKTVSSLSALFDTKTKTIQSELIADKLGWVRISAGTVVSIASDSTYVEDTQKNTLERLISGGGNLYLDFTLPIYTNYAEDLFTYYLFTNIKFASDIEGYGNNIDTSTFNGSLGICGYVGVSSHENKFNFFLASDTYTYRGNKDFYKNLGLQNNKWILNSNITFGVTFENKYRVFCRTNMASETSLRTQRIAVGIQLIPNL